MPEAHVSDGTLGTNIASLGEVPTETHQTKNQPAWSQAATESLFLGVSHGSKSETGNIQLCVKDVSSLYSTTERHEDFSAQFIAQDKMTR